MKQIMCYIPFIFILFSCSAGSYTVVTQINNEIDQEINSEIENISSSIIESIKTQNNQSLTNFLSQKLLALENFDLESFTKQLNSFLTGNTFITKDQYYSRLADVKEDSMATIIGSLDEDKFIINNLKFHNNESYNLFLTSTNPGPQYLLFMSFSKYGNDWKANIIQLGNYSLIGETAPILYKRSKNLYERGHITSSALLNIALNNLLRPAPFLQYKNEAEYKNFIKSTSNKISENYNFPIKLASIDIIGLNFHFITKDGIMPVILYLTDTEFNKVLLKKEIQENKEKLLEAFPFIDQDFKYAFMRAYHEMPTDKNKTYDLYTTSLEFE